MTATDAPAPAPRQRLPAAQRREQLIGIGRGVFASRGYDATTVEEIVLRAGVSKPVFYEHFAGKEPLYALLVEREMDSLLVRFTGALSGDSPRRLLEQACLALLSYIEDETDGFRILVHTAPVGSESGGYVSLISRVATRVEHILDREFRARGYETTLAGLYSQALVGMVAQTGQWWLDARTPDRDVVAAHLVNLAWHGLSRLEAAPGLTSP